MSQPQSSSTTAMQPRQRAWGVGIGYRYCIHDVVMRNRGLIDFLEVPAGDYLTERARRRVDPDEAMLREAAEHFPIICHGTEVSIGSAAPPDPQYLRDVSDFVERIPIGEYSEHLSFTCMGDESVGSFVCMPFTDLGVEVAASRSRDYQRFLGLPLLLENVSYYFGIPDAGMTEQEFVGRVCEEADCGILLDVANVFINATNHGYEPETYIRELPGDRVHHAHYCGASTDPDGFLIDTHRTITTDQIWGLLDLALAKTDLRALIFERDENLDKHDEIHAEVLRARHMFRKHRPKDAPEELRAPVQHDPQPMPEQDVPASYKDMAVFQETLLRMLTDEDLAVAVDREGELALQHTKLSRDDRRVLASIPTVDRERLGSRLRQARQNEIQRAQDQRRAQMMAWMNREPRA